MKTTQNDMGVSALEFNIDALDTILKDLRNARRAVLAIETGRAETESKVEAAKVALQQALESADLEAITKHTDELKRGMRKLAESPTDKIEAFDSAVNRFVEFATLNDDSIAEETPIELEIKEAA